MGQSWETPGGASRLRRAWQYKSDLLQAAKRQLCYAWDTLASGAAGKQALAAGKPPAVAAFAHICPFRTVRHHFVKLGLTQAIAASAGQAFILDQGRLVRFGLRRLDKKPVVSRLGGPVARLCLVAMAMREEPGGDFAGCRKWRAWRCHKCEVYFR